MNNKKWAKYLKQFIGPVSDRAIPCLLYLDWLNDCDRILDVGCGTGRLAAYLQKKGKNVTGISLNPQEIQIGNERSGMKLDIWEGDIHEIPSSDKLFDAVIAWDVLEHTLAPYIILSEVYRVLKPGGKLLCFIPGKDWIDCGYHCIVLTGDQLRHLVRIVGFNSLESIKDETRGATKGGTIYKIIK